jgi:hypothetical protein
LLVAHEWIDYGRVMPNEPTDIAADLTAIHESILSLRVSLKADFEEIDGRCGSLESLMLAQHRDTKKTIAFLRLCRRRHQQRRRTRPLKEF